MIGPRTVPHTTTSLGPAPQHNMTPSLPLELENLVIDSSLEELGVLQAQRRRAELRLVCRAWPDSIDMSRHLIVVGHDEVVNLSDSLRSGHAPAGSGQRVRSILVDVESASGAQPTADAVATLLRQVPNVERVELVANHLVLQRGRWTMDEAIVGALAQLGKIAHFRIGSGRSRDGPRLSNSVLERSVRRRSGQLACETDQPDII